MNQSLTDFQFVHAADFAAYLLENKLKESSVENIRLIRELNLPLLELFAHLPEEELLRMTEDALSLFLEQMKQGTALEKAFNTIDAWKADQVPGIPRQKVSLSDLIISYSIRRQLFLHFLPDYTTDCRGIIYILQEMEGFYVRVERYAFEAYLDIYSEELHKKNEFLSSLINNSVEGIAAFDSAMRVLEWNPFLEKLNGLSKEEVIDKYIYELFPGYEHSQEAKATRQAFEGNPVYLSDRPYHSRKGWYDVHVVPIYGTNQQVTSVLSMIRDVTERKEAEIRLKEYQEELLVANEELQEQKEELAAMNEQLQENLTRIEEIQQSLHEKQERLLEAQSIAHLGHWEYNPDTNTVYWSDEMKKLFGYELTLTTLSFASYLDKVHAQDQPALVEVVDKCLQLGLPFELEHRIVLESGAIRWLYCQGRTAIKEGASHTLIGTALDITRRKEAELKLEQDQHFIESLAQTSPDVITLYDLEKMINLYSSKEIYEILGYTPQELEVLKKKGVEGLVEVIHPEDLPMILAFLESYKKYNSDKAREMEYRIKDNKGEYHWILDRYNVFKRSKEGFPIQILGIARDITPRKWAEEEMKRLNYTLQETNEELTRSEEALKELNSELEQRVELRTSELTQKNELLSRINADLDNFIYTASHDLKSPIANLDGLLRAYSKKVRDKLLPEEITLLTLMRQSVDRFNNTIQDLTNVAKVQKSIEEEEIEGVSLAELVKEVRSDVSQLIAHSNGRILEDLQVDRINFARKNLRSILYNLLTNAIKYSSPERVPHIKIEARYAGEYVLICIEDNGRGIPQRQQQKIFSLFKRIHTDVEGSGIGLYIVKRIVDNNGGRIEVESVEGKGTIFKVYLKTFSLPIN